MQVEMEDQINEPVDPAMGFLPDSLGWEMLNLDDVVCTVRS